MILTMDRGLSTMDIRSKLIILKPNKIEVFRQMFKRKLKLSDYFLIAANLLPVLGTWIWGWNAIEIFTVYCLETILVGIFTLVKMGIVTVVRKQDDWYNQGTKTRVSGLFFMLFFIMHYGIFLAVQMGIFFSVSGVGDFYKINFANFFFK